MGSRPNGGIISPKWLALILTAAVGLGCTKEETLRDVVLRAADLEQTRATRDAELRMELARIESEGGAPLTVRPPLPPEKANLAAALATVIDPKLRNGILERTQRLFPEGRFDYTPLELAEARQFIRKHEARRKRIHAALARAECGFRIDFRLGFFYEPAFIDEVTIACRFLAFEIANALAEGDVAATLEPANAMCRLTACLGQERLLPARIAAAALRAEGLLVLESIANHPHTRQSDLWCLFDAVEAQLDSWPSDAECLIGDRAMTLHAYECIRQGLLRWILTSDEKERFRKELNFDSLPEVIDKTIDRDELFYLQTMRRHIELCSEPYFRRQAGLVRLEKALDEKRTSSDREDYPLLAAVLFLPGIDEAHETMARDRARCEGFSLALAAAAGKEQPPYAVSPHHGRAYEVVRESQRVVVKLGEPDERDAVIAIPPAERGE